MKVLGVIAIAFAVIFGGIVAPLFYEVCTSAIPKLCVLLDIVRLEDSVLFLFRVSFWAKIFLAIAKAFELSVKVYEM